ncbi:MAG: AraC family transcriptional regulator [Oscillospiraceae bacterium]|nr:AraC family transcriptional regulator [Oscillospiraceae bacterium]
MKGESKEAIKNSIVYIESKLQEKIGMDELAEHVFFSRTHYQRLFHAIVGQPVMEYIKMRRLQQASQMLCQTNTTILEIALEYGYASHEGFTRAFKALYGIPPTKYRKMHAAAYNKVLSTQEIIDMMTKELTEKITQHSTTIGTDLMKFINETENLCQSTEEAITEIGPNGKGIVIVMTQLRNLALKAKECNEKVNMIHKGEQSVYEISDAIYSMLKEFDELSFQMDLLRFLSGIEVLRAGSIDVLAAFQSKLDALAKTFLKQHDNATNLLNELISLLLEDIQKESIKCFRDTAQLMKQVTVKGTKLIEETKAVIADEPRGAGFLFILDELKTKTEKIDMLASIIDGYADEYGKLEGWNNPKFDTVEIDRALSTLSEIAFTMNLVTFNTTIETARSGDRDEFVKLTDEIGRYTNELHQIYATCSEYINECRKLNKLVEIRQEEKPDTVSERFQISMDDIIFQGSILASQLGMESARAGLDVFKNHGKAAVELVAQLVKNRKYDLASDKSSLSSYIDSISSLSKNLNSDAVANMPRGTTFAYITQELDAFVEKMGAILSNAGN